MIHLYHPIYFLTKVVYCRIAFMIKVIVNYYNKIDIYTT